MIESQEVKNYVIFQAKLPICLHLDSRLFAIPYKKNTIIEITTENILSEEETYLGSATNMEVLSDSFSHFRFTKLIVKIPDFEINTYELLDAFNIFRKPFFMSVNKFIDAARIALNRYSIKNYNDYVDFYQEIHVKSSRDPEINLVKSLFPGQGLSTIKPLRNEEEHNKIQELLVEGFPLYEGFLADSRKEYYYYNLPHSLLNAVIALEIRVSETIRVIGTRKGIDEKSLNAFIMDVVLTGNIKTTLKLITPQSIAWPEDDVFEKCKGAITLRNKIMHEGKRDITTSDVETAILNIQKMIDFCGYVLNSV